MGGGAVFAIIEIGQKLFDKLRKRAYRRSYVGEHVRRGIAYQIRTLREQRDWSQAKLAKAIGKPQSVVSRLEDPSYGKVTVQTLLEVADVYDVALQVRFVPFSSFLRATRDLSTASMKVPSFEAEMVAPLKIVPGSEIETVAQIPTFGMGAVSDAVARPAPLKNMNVYAYVQ
jgi:transcriptional regulator with XRE-family HTH domain